MKPIHYILFFLLNLLVFFAVPAQAAQTEKIVLFKGSQHQLDVYFLRGDEPGPTVMVQGGIQGDEPAGYLSAQLLTTTTVKRGNLIIVPRANLPSIHARKRQLNVDLNRRFDKDYNKFYEDRLARAIRFLLAGSDAFIHLHEGSGFYHPTYVNDWRNPNRYGQSIIIDTPIFDNRIHLASAVQEVLPRLNGDIVQADYRFQLFNTNTFADNTSHPEQRKSLTYYALSGLGIPALAIEVSKNINTLPWKVRRQVLACELFLSHFGVDVTPVEFDDAIVEECGEPLAMLMVNGRPVTLRTEETLVLSPGSLIEPVVAAPGPDQKLPPAWSVFAADRDELNILDAPRLALTPFDSLRAKADGRQQKVLPVQWKGKWPKASGKGKTLFACWLNGELRFVSEGDTLETVVGDRLIIEGVWGGAKNEVLNLKGFVSTPYANDGQDMGSEIVLDPDTFLAKYFLKGSSDGDWRARVVRETDGKPRDEFYLRMQERKVLALRFTGPDGAPATIEWKPGEPAMLPPGDYSLDGVLSNGGESLITPTTGTRLLSWGERITAEPGKPVQLTLRCAATFRPIGSMMLAAADS